MRDHREDMSAEKIDISELVRQHSGLTYRPQGKQRKKPIQTKVGQGGSKARKILRRQR